MVITSLGHLTDLAFLRLDGSTIEDHGDHLVVRTPQNPTFWWGNFLVLERAPSVDDTGRWLDVFTAAFPGAGHRVFAIADVTATVADLAGFVDAGCSVEGNSVMTADPRAVHEPPFPNVGAEIRVLTTSEDWERRAQLSVACRDEQHEEQSHLEFARRTADTTRRLSEAGHGAWFGAFVDGRLLASLGLFLARPGLARYHVVETHPDARRQGLAGTLVHHAAQFGTEHLDARKLVMVADPDDVAIRIYRALGFADTERTVQVERAPGG